MKKIAILGSTGSIGTQTLEVARENGDLQITALAAGNNIELLEKQIREFHPGLVAVWKEEKPVFHGCPGTRMKIMDHKAEEVATEQTATVSSQLSQWPVQIKLVPVNAPYFKDANLLIAADCTAYAYGNFHQKFIKNKVTLIGCPKLDEGDYSEKLTQIIANNDIKSVTIVRMEVPCCGGLENAAKKAIQDSGKFLPWQVHTISIDGKILEA